MPITAWNCPICSEVVALDHFAESACGLKVPADYATAILHDNDDRYISDAVTITVGLGCPRSRAIEESVAVAVDPLEYNALLIGRAWDQLLEKHAPEGTSKIIVDGEIGGIHIYGEIDRLIEYNNEIIIIDHKHSNNWAQGYAKKEGVKMEHRVQTSIYAELYAQKFRKRPTRGLIFNHYSGAPGGSLDVEKYLLPFVYPLLPVSACLEFKPHGGRYTVLELYQQADAYEKWKTTDGVVRVEAFDLPLAGESMAFGSKSFCDYCQVRAACFEQAKGAPF